MARTAEKTSGRYHGPRNGASPRPAAGRSSSSRTSEVRRAALRALQPPPAVPLADWIEENVYLPPTVSALPGKMRLWAYQRGVCEAIDNPEIERISVVKSARVGFSSLVTATLASYVLNQPCPVLAVLPTIDDARDYAVGDVEGTFDASPALRGLLDAEADETGRSTLLSRRFPGGSLKFLAARSPRTLRRHNARVLMLDETDAMDVGPEGDPIALATMRTLAFRDRLIFAGSTPIFDDGPISRLYAESDQRIFEVPCPSCGAFAEITWAQIEWTEGQPETAAYRCPHCRELVDERHKPAMVEAGRWRATAVAPGHAGFRINALVSPHANAAWPRLVAEFLASKDHPARLQTFVNLTLGQPWRETHDDLDEHELMARREPFGLTAIPAEVLLVTVGVDCQDDRLELVFVGHGKAEETFILGHSVIWGAIDAETTWLELNDALGSTWGHPNGGTLRVDAAVIDSGDGGHADLVHAFTRSRFGRRIVSGKGASGFARPNIQKSSAKRELFFVIGVDAVKSQLFARLSRGSGVRFSADLDATFFEQLTSERKVVRYYKGQPVRRFERIPGKRAEALDAVVYAIAARSLIGLNLERRADELASPRAPERRPAIIRSRWLER